MNGQTVFALYVIFGVPVLIAAAVVGFLAWRFL